VNSEEPGLADDGHHCGDTRLNFSAAKLDVYRHERLAYTEPPQKISQPRPVPKRAAALLKAMSAWALAHL
jgi:hypothetical protein